MNNGIGLKIKKLREQKDISQDDLAFQLNVSQSYISKIESGTTEKLDFLFMQKVADFFKVEPQYFLEGDTVFNVETSNNSAIGNIHLSTINNNISENILENLFQNQQQINQLIENQNKLIEKLLKN